MLNSVHIIAANRASDNIEVWDVETVEGQKLIGIIEKVEGPEGIDELASYWFTDTFGHSEEFDSINEARDYAEQSINPVTIN